MRFSRSLRKSVAAYLAFTMLSVPIAGCDFLDDFFDGDKPGGKPTASTSGKKNEVKLPKGAVSFKLPRVNNERLAVEAVGMDALRYYVHARIATERLSRMNAKNSKPKDYEKLLRETAKLWQCAELYAKAARGLAGELAKKETKPGYKPLAMLDKSPFGDMFFSVAYAREGTDSDEAGYRPMTGYERSMIEAHPDWAKGIVKNYEKYPAGKGIEGLSKHLGVDAQEASRQFNKAVETLDQDTVAGIPTGFSNQTAGKLYDVGAKTALVVKGACQTTLLVGGAILTGGSTGPAAVAGAINTVAATADWVIEISNIAHEVFTGETNPTLDEIKKYTGTISAITSGATLATSFGDFALKGEKAVKITHDALKGAGLKNITGYLDKYKIGGAGVSALLDSSIWVTERGMELSEGKILGFQVFTTKDGRTVMIPVEIPADKFQQPVEISKVSATQLLAMTPAELAARLETINELIKVLGNPSKDILDEDARRRQEMADEEARRRNEAKRNGNVGIAGQVDLYQKVQRIKEGRNQSQSQSQSQSRNRNQKPEGELPYEPPKLAGYYTITSPSGDVAMRAIIKATGDNTIRAVQVQKKTDKKGTALFSATIDPKTGRGKTDQGAIVQFSRNGSGAYTGVLEDGYKTWRMTKH